VDGGQHSTELPLPMDRKKHDVRVELE
jgi:hypothetical protein